MKKLFISAIAVCAFLISALNVSAQAVDSVKKATIVVKNLTCNGDMPTIKKQLLNQEGVDEVNFTARANEASSFTILFHTSMISRKRIEEIIESTPGCDDKTTTPYKVKKEQPQKPQKP